MQINTQDADLPRLSSINHQVQSSKSAFKKGWNMKVLLWSMLAGAALMGGCAGVPKDAPEELKSADAAIKHAKSVDADDQMPNTVKTASKRLDHSPLGRSEAAF
jgi:hypothetical protein